MQTRSKIFLLASLIFVLSGLSQNIFSQTTYVSANSGEWHKGTTWVGGVVPSATDHATISDGTTVTLKANAFITDLYSVAGGIVDGNNKSLNVSGKLTIDGTYTSKNAAAQDFFFSGDTLSGIGSIIIDFSDRDFICQSSFTILPSIGICSPLIPMGYPVPFHLS